MGGTSLAVVVPKRDAMVGEQAHVLIESLSKCPLGSEVERGSAERAVGRQQCPMFSVQLEVLLDEVSACFRVAEARTPLSLLMRWLAVNRSVARKPDEQLYRLPTRL